MKSIYSLALLLALPASAMAQAPALTFVKSIDVGATAIQPQGIAFYNGDIYGAGFGNGIVFRIADAAGASTVSSVGTLAPAFPGSRGPQDVIVDAVANTAYVIADDGTNARIYPVTDLNTTPVIGAAATTSAVRFCGGTLYGGNLLLGKSNASTMEVVTFAGTNVATSPNAALASPAGYGSPIRDIVVVNDIIYYTGNASNSTRLSSFAPTTAGNITAGTFAQVSNPLAAGGPANFLGITTWTNDTTTYLVIPYNDSVVARGIAFYDVAALSATPNVILTPTELAAEQMTGIDIATVGGVTYLAVASQTGGAVANEVHLFTLPAVSSVSGWKAFN